ADLLALRGRERVPQRLPDGLEPLAFVLLALLLFALASAVGLLLPLGFEPPLLAVVLRGRLVEIADHAPERLGGGPQLPHLLDGELDQRSGLGLAMPFDQLVGLPQLLLRRAL